MSRTHKIMFAIALIFVLAPIATAGTLSTYRDVVETSVHQLYANEVSEGVYELEADANAGDAERNRIYAAYITDYSPGEYSNLSFHLDQQSNTNHNFHLTTYWLKNGELSDIGSGDYEEIDDFGQPPAGEIYSSDLSDRTEENGKMAVVVEGTHYWYEDDYLRVVISEVSTPGVSICDRRGVFNECISNRTHEIDGQYFNISSVFESRETSVFQALNTPATINVTNSSTISGLWEGSFNIMTIDPVVKPGADFRPVNGRITVGS